MKKCTVVGGGAMGRQIAMNAAINHYQVAVCETANTVRADLYTWKDEYLAGRVAKGRLTQEQADDIQERFQIVENLEAACEDAYLVIEAIIEDETAKRNVLGQISRCTGPETVIATNSSYMVSSMFRDAVVYPERLANLHYFMPALVMKLVEVVKGEHTSEETVTRLMEYSKSVGKTPVLVRREIDGFIVNNILSAIKEEAYRLVDAGVCTFSDLDTAVELGLGHPMGPFKLDDMAGLDIRYNVLNRRFHETGTRSYGFDMIHERYQQGRLGKKTKHGFYDYE